MIPSRFGKRRLLGALCAAGAMAAFAVPAAAQTSAAWPQRTVRIVVGNAPGGGTDIAARLIAAKLGPMWGQPVVVENRPGASGTIGADLVAKAQDGHTLLLSPQTSTAIATHVAKQLPYDVLKDFTPITVVASVPTLLVVSPTLQVKTFQDFSAYAKTNGKTMSYGSGGKGSTQHLAGEMLNLALGTQMLHVPYRGENPGLTDVMGGQLPMMFVTMSTAMPHLKAGKLQALAVASLQRSPAAPDVPTIAESGIAGFEMAPWYGLFGPAGMPRELAARVQADVVKVLAMPDVKEQFMRQGFDLVGSTPEQTAAYLRKEVDKYGRLIKDAKLTLE